MLLALQHGKTNPMDVGANFVLETAQRITDDYVDSRRYFLQWVIDRQAYLTRTPPTAHDLKFSALVKEKYDELCTYELYKKIAQIALMTEAKN